MRVDYNLTNAHRLGFTYRYNEFNSTPDFLNSAEPRFPGFPNQAGQYSQRYMWQVNLRSMLGKSVVNEVRTGMTDAMGDGTYFGKGVTPGSSTARGLAASRRTAVGLQLQLIPYGFDGYTLTGATAYYGSSAGVASQFSVVGHGDVAQGQAQHRASAATSAGPTCGTD